MIIKREFNFFEQQLISDDGLEKVDLREINFIEDFKKYILDYPDIEIVIYPTDSLSAGKMKIMNQIIIDSADRVRWGLAHK